MTDQPSQPAAFSRTAAFAIQVDRNVTLQIVGMTMVVLAALSVLPSPLVAAWMLVAIAVVAVEHRCLRLMAAGRSASPMVGRCAAAARIMASALYAAAALALIVAGGPGERLFAVALMCASMLNGLMRYYRAPGLMAASLAPHILVLAFVGLHLARIAVLEGHWLSAAAAGFAIAVIAMQIASTRAQLAGAWTELMTARREAEERARVADSANRAKSRFLATMSHELRTPLNGVLGMVQGLSGERMTPAQHERVDVIRRSSESLLAVLNDLLVFSQEEADALELHMEAFDLAELVSGVAAVHRPRAAGRSLAFDVEIADDARGRYLGDAARIRRVLHSLIDNAVKFTHMGGVVVDVQWAENRLLFRVADSGIGISEDNLGRLFQGFFQADNSLARRYAGTGVGLAVARKLTSLMGGALESSSVLGHGSAFTLSLPLERTPPVAASTDARPGVGGADRCVPLRVLAAEDNAVNQLVLRTLLAPQGISPTVVADGRQALYAWESESYDIVLMDIQMPDMDGIEAARAIRSRERATGRPRTPIIAVTANAMHDQRAEYEAAGMDGFVAKPVDAAELLAVMQRALAQTRMDGAEADPRSRAA
jgi:signal transduction histidine kinase/CheY-like chemotaxis protein